MRHLKILAGIVIGLSLLAAPVRAQTAGYNSNFGQFSVAVTATSQGFTIASKLNPAGIPPITPSSCSAWLVENDSSTVTVWLVWGLVASTSSSTLPVAVTDAGNTAVRQMRLLPGQAKSIDAYTNTYIAIIGSAAGPSNVRFEQTCK